MFNIEAAKKCYENLDEVRIKDILDNIEQNIMQAIHNGEGIYRQKVYNEKIGKIIQSKLIELGFECLDPQDDVYGCFYITIYGWKNN